jgi:hypothetical protein
MHHAVGMRIGQRARDVAEHVDAQAHRQRAFALEVVAQRLPFDKRHGVVRQVVGPAGRQQRNDVRLLERRRHPDLPLEALGTETRGQIPGEELDDDRAMQARLARHKDARHAATAQFALDNVALAERRLERGHDLRRVGSLPAVVRVRRAARSVCDHYPCRRDVAIPVSNAAGVTGCRDRRPMRPTRRDTTPSSPRRRRRSRSAWS